MLLICFLTAHIKVIIVVIAWIKILTNLQDGEISASEMGLRGTLGFEIRKRRFI